MNKVYKLDLEDLVDIDDDDDDVKTSEHGKLYTMLDVEDSLDIYMGEEIKTELHKYIPLLSRLKCIPENHQVNMFLSCSGGSVAIAQRICHAMRRCRGHVTAWVDSPCASAGSLIALAGDELKMTRDSHLMFHGANGGTSGNLSNAKKGLDITHKWCRANDIEFAYPFLTVNEIDIINDTALELHVYGDDKDIKKRMKRHFK